MDPVTPEEEQSSAKPSSLLTEWQGSRVHLPSLFLSTKQPRYQAVAFRELRQIATQGPLHPLPLMNLEAAISSVRRQLGGLWRCACGRTPGREPQEPEHGERKRFFDKDVSRPGSEVVEKRRGHRLSAQIHVVGLENRIEDPDCGRI
jgi:hypothetical protein